MGRTPFEIPRSVFKPDYLRQNKSTPHFKLILLAWGFLFIRCIKDNAYVNLHSHQKNTAQFKVNVFGFLTSYDVIYLQCKVAVCKAEDRSSRCPQGCAGRSKREAGPTEATEEQMGHFQMVGPLEVHKGTDQRKTLA